MFWQFLSGIDNSLASTDEWSRRSLVWELMKSSSTKISDLGFMKIFYSSVVRSFCCLVLNLSWKRHSVGRLQSGGLWIAPHLSNLSCLPGHLLSWILFLPTSENSLLLTHRRLQRSQSLDPRVWGHSVTLISASCLNRMGETDSFLSYKGTCLRSFLCFDAFTSQIGVFAVCPYLSKAS